MKIRKSNDEIRTGKANSKKQAPQNVPKTAREPMIGGNSRPTTSKLGTRGTRPSEEKAKGHLCPTGSARQKLVEVLEGHGVSVHGFDGLRADAYEKHLAAKSLAELDRFYGLLLGAGRTYKEIAAECPVWGDEPKQPHWTTLKDIKNRIVTERQIADVGPKIDILKQLAERLTGVSLSQKVVILEGVLALLSAELMGLKQEGKLVIENLPVVDRIIKAVGVKARVEQGAERVRIDDTVRNGRLQLDREKFEWYKAGQPITKPAEPVHQETVDEIFLRVHGVTTDEWGAGVMPGDSLVVRKFKVYNMYRKEAGLPPAVMEGKGANAEGGVQPMIGTGAESNGGAGQNLNNKGTEDAKEEIRKEDGNDEAKAPSPLRSAGAVQKGCDADVVSDAKANDIGAKGHLCPTSSNELRTVMLRCNRERALNIKEDMEAELLPDMQYVTYTGAPTDMYPGGLGVCNVTRQTVDMGAKRYLSQEWRKFWKN